MNNATTDIATLDPQAYAVIDKDTGTVLGTNLALVRVDVLSESEREGIMSSDMEAVEYATQSGTSLHLVRSLEMESLTSRAYAWSAVVDHPAMRDALTSGSGTGLERVLARLDRLAALDK